MKKYSKPLFLLAPAVLLLLFFFPLWKITLEAPQYPDGISMYIWLHQITGDSDYTLQNVNILNHYIGMQAIEPDSIPELTYFPYVVGLMIVMGIGVWLTGKPKLFWTWAIVMLILGVLGIFDFYLWEYDYGHNLDPKAAIKVPGMVYQPPLFGSKWLLNFKAISLPHVGGLMLGLSILLSVMASYFRTKELKR